MPFTQHVFFCFSTLYIHGSVCWLVCVFHLRTSLTPLLPSISSPLQPLHPPSLPSLPPFLPSLPPSLTSLVHRGTVEDTELVEGLVLDQKASHLAGGITQVEKAKIGLIQFCISPPKTDVNEQNNTCDTMLVVAFWLYFRISLLWQRFGSDDYVCVVSFRLVFAMCQVQWS